MPELCLVADKPDEFSVPVSIDSLIVTEAACIRLGPHEGVNVSKDPDDGGLVIDPINHAKLFITPSQPDLPGFRVLGIKMVKKPEGGYQTYFKQDKPEWREWNALRDTR
jgi:hypothetical protein